MKLYEKCVRFMKNVTTTIPDEQMTKIKVVYLQKLWNFVVESFLI
jgi:chorismate mutase